MSSGNWEKHHFLLGGSESPAQGHLLSWEGAGLSASSCLDCALAFPGIVRALLGLDLTLGFGLEEGREGLLPALF